LRREPLYIFFLGVSGLNKIKSFLLDAAEIYTGKRVTRGAAALAYYLTMTIFPVLICLYYMLGTKYDEAMDALNIVQNLLSSGTYQTIEDFLSYVSDNNSRAMFIAAVVVLIGSASASFRSFQTTVGDMQGQIRFRGFWGYMFSFAFSVGFLAVMYGAILVMMTGSWFLELVVKWLPFVGVDMSWTWMRFIILFGVILLQICLLYRVTVPRTNGYRTFIGALIATAALVLVCMIFSAFISASANYPLVYGSLASVILLMFWLYLCSLMIIFGMVVNIVIRDRALAAGQLREAEDDDASGD
jgi:membrane protein